METNSWNNDSRTDASPPRNGSEDGFTLLEMVVAMIVMMVGLLALAQTIGFALVMSNEGRNVTNTKLLVVGVLEQMETLRNTKQLTFGQIANSGSVDNSGATQSFAGFPNDFRPVSSNPGPDGIFGTTDDLIDAGSDGVYSTRDDFTNPALARPNYTRQILITSLSTNLKKVQVTLKSPGANGKTDTTVGVSYLNNDANSNFLP
jgi:type II secretory pathway pseudopilin PulG